MDDETKRLRRLLAEAEARIAVLREQVETHSRDHHFLRLRVNVLQAFTDELLGDMALRANDASVLAERNARMLEDRDRAMRETIQTYEEKNRALVELVITLNHAASQNIGRAAYNALSEAYASTRDAYNAILTSQSWRLTRRLKRVAALFRGGSSALR